MSDKKYNSSLKIHELMDFKSWIMDTPAWFNRKLEKAVKISYKFNQTYLITSTTTLEDGISQNYSETNFIPVCVVASLLDAQDEHDFVNPFQGKTLVVKDWILKYNKKCQTRTSTYSSISNSSKGNMNCGQLISL